MLHQWMRAGLFLGVAAFSAASALADEWEDNPVHEITRIARLSPVTDQDNTFQCYIVAGVSRLDFAANRRLKNSLELADGEGIKFSPKYIFYKKTEYDVIEQIKHFDFSKTPNVLLSEDADELPQDRYYSQGGVFPDVVAAAKRFGLVLESDYPGFPHRDRELFEELNDDIFAVYEDKAKKKEVKEWSKKELEDLREKVDQILDRHLNGHPPDMATYERKAMSPKKLFEKLLPGWNDAKARELEYQYAETPPFIEIQKREKVPAFDGSLFGSFFTNIHDEEENPQRVLEVLSKSLKKGEAVLIHYLVKDENLTQQKGAITFKGREKLTQTKAEIWKDASLLEHYVLAVGARWNGDRISEILVKNTWDDSIRERSDPHWGYHWLEPDYFFMLEGVELSDSIFDQLSGSLGYH